MKRILVIYATAGIGHKKAAFAIKEALGEINPKDIEVSIMDALDYTNSLFKWTYLKIYLLMVNRFPLLWGFLYYLTDNSWFNLGIAKMRRLNNWLSSRPFEAYLLDFKPDVIVSTHFFAGEVISDLKRRGLLTSHLVTVVTDYRLHAWWVTDLVDLYVVGGDDAKTDLIMSGVPTSKIKILGIPAEPVFSKKIDKEKILQIANFNEGVFTILVIGGGFGVGPIEEIVKIADGISKPVQIIAICGHNRELERRLERLKPSLKARINILGFVNNVYDYMEISSILISKSGGITVTEGLAKELPIVVISPIIGQETRNSDFLVKNGAALKIEKPDDLKGVLEDLAAHPEKIEAMRESIRKIRRPRACYDIANTAIEMCG